MFTRIYKAHPVSYAYGMNNLEETQIAELLVVCATDLATNYSDEADWDAAIVATLARALEIATGRTLKPLEEIFLTGQN